MFSVGLLSFSVIAKIPGAQATGDSFEKAPRPPDAASGIAFFWTAGVAKVVH